MEYEARRGFLFSTPISMRNGRLAKMRPGARRDTRRPRMVMSLSTPEATMVDSSQPSSRYNRLLPVLMAARPMPMLMATK